MNKIIFTLLLFSFSFSGIVDLNRATQIAQNFSNSRVNSFALDQVDIVEENNTTYFYIFKLMDKGFIVVSAHDSAMPVLAYSFNNIFSSTDIPPQVDYLLNVYKDNIDTIIDNNFEPTNDIRSLWDLYSAPFDYVQERSVTPLLTCNWNQDSPWNNMCPTDQDGPGGNVYAGCVAISMVQIMYYWGYPEVGYGSHGYTAGSYGYQYADYANSTYDYSQMEDNFATTEAQELIYHAAVAVNMGFSPDGSGASVMGGSNSAYSAMKNYFIYDHGVSRVQADDYSTSQYRQFLESDLDENQPIIYVGYSNDGGHAWNIDGYEGDYFHNNFGWGGSNNGYYLLSALNGFNSGQGALINLIPEQLDEPHIVLTDTEYIEFVGDGDQVVNPGETVRYYTTLENYVPWNDASDVSIILESLSDDIQVQNESIIIGNLNAGQEYTPAYPFLLTISDLASLGSHPLKLHVLANDGEYLETFDISLDVSLFQAGFPYDTFDQILTNPLVVDIDGDSDNDIIFSDNMGFVHVVESDGTVSNDNFPYEIGDNVWGSIAADDIDLDGDIEFIVTSKTKSIYIFDKNGLENQYYADKYLLGTPAIGQLDSDPYLEIVAGSFGPGSTSENQLFVINHDATDVEGFPLTIGEKMKVGVALADFNANGIDDIVFGTDSDNLHLIYDDLSYAPGFPLNLNDKLQSAPSIVSYADQKYIFVGSKDDHLYSIDSNGNIRFAIETDGNIYSSPSFNDTEQGLMIFFGSSDGKIYNIDIDGNSYEGWPSDVSGEVIGSLVFADLDNDNQDEIISSVNSNIIILNQDGTDFIYPSILHELPLSSGPTVLDLNQNGTLEIMVGTGTDLSSIDFKFESNSVSDWNMYRGNKQRSGFYFSTSNFSIGDINQDSTLDVLDIVMQINFVIGNTTPTNLELSLSDINSDNTIDILDIVSLVNLILG